MGDSIITYESLYDALRRERSFTELQKLDPDFFKNVVKYLEEKESILGIQRKKSSGFSSELGKTQIQIENVRKLIKEIYENRERKIIQLAILSSKTEAGNVDLSSMLNEEKLFYNSLLEQFNRYRKGILHNLLNKQPPVIEESPKELKSHISQQDNTRLVRFTHPTPKFVGEDMNIYGPFEAEDIANLPEKVATLLIEKKRAVGFNV